MIKSYLSRPPDPILALEWTGESIVNSLSEFNPNIVWRDGAFYLEEFDDHWSRLEKGYFVIKETFGYESLTPKEFHQFYMENPNGNV